MAEDPKNEADEAKAANPETDEKAADESVAGVASETAESKPSPSIPETDEELAASNEAWEGGHVPDAKAPEPEKGLSPEAIQKRLDALGGNDDDEDDKSARQAEERLHERRSQMKSKKGRGKAGLQSAASKRLDKIGSKGPEKRKKKVARGETSRVATAAPFEGDALLETAGKAQKWLVNNAKVAGIVAAVAVLVGIGIGVTFWMQHRKNTAASTALDIAVQDAEGRIGDPSKEDDDDNRPKDTSPIFKTVAERQDAALAKFRDVTTKYPGTGASYLARLNEGALLLDKHDLPNAIAALNDVKTSPLAQVDSEVKGRSLELLGFAYEQKAADGDAAALDEALKTFRELENTDVMGFQELGEYHQARIFEKKGDKDQAKALLKKVYEATTKPGENHPFPYLENLSEDRLRALDPTALPPKQPGKLGGPGGNKMTEAQMRQLIEQLKKQQQAAGGGGGHP